MERRLITIHGIVQGVGFRPFVCNLARTLDLSGIVKNSSGAVTIEVEGNSRTLDIFVAKLRSDAPPLARLDRLGWQLLPTRSDTGFRIASSDDTAAGAVFISPDVATCSDCLRELSDKADHRFAYPFLNCTNCGPRLTIITGAPYDRPKTTMAGFAMCAVCQAEYDDPGNRRFHAQPTACPACGPHLSLLGAQGQPIRTEEPLQEFAKMLLRGAIGAIKGLGGYHLACLVNDPQAVTELRRRKRRDEKPFAVMVANIAGVETFCDVGNQERRLLQSPAAPIVLLRKKTPCPIADGVAPRNPWLGVMLAYAPVHHLLLAEVGGAPLTMTSGNISDDPIATSETEATSKLAGIADVYLIHNRPIHVRCDDSVIRVVDGQELPLRRSRGYAPRPIELPFACPRPVLAVGGQMKATFALGRDNQAFLSHHLGDLDHYEAYRAFLRDIELYQELFAVRPECLVHDSHPDYVTTHFAKEWAARAGCPLISVQHHHAHMASCMAEHGLTGPVIGVSLDGTGYGIDGAIWGGEFLIGAYKTFERRAHFRYVPMPGGDKAIREPWRMALAHLADAGIEFPTLHARVSPQELRTVKQLIARRLFTPLTSSAGRLFDAVASLAGIRARVSFEGQAAMELEFLATDIEPCGAYPFSMEHASDTTSVIDTRPLVRAVVHDVQRQISPAYIARRFHGTMVEIIARVCSEIRRQTGLSTTVLSGGVFQNALLASEVNARLCIDGFQVYRHQLVPPNDGGLSLGQVAIAAARMT